MFRGGSWVNNAEALPVGVPPRDRAGVPGHLPGLPRGPQFRLVQSKSSRKRSLERRPKRRSCAAQRSRSPFEPERKAERPRSPASPRPVCESRRDSPTCRRRSRRGVWGEAPANSKTTDDVDRGGFSPARHKPLAEAGGGPHSLEFTLQRVPVGVHALACPVLQPAWPAGHAKA